MVHIVIDLSCWNLTIPVGSPTVIETKELGRGYQSEFFKDDGSKITFWAPVSGSHTKNSTYPRSEFRETQPSGNGELYNWRFYDADNYLRAGMSVNQVPSTGKIVIGQIHAYNNDNPMLKLVYKYDASKKTGDVVAQVRSKASQEDADNYTVMQNVPLDTRISYTIHLSKGGTLSVNTGLNGKTYTWSGKMQSDWRKETLYFKAGAYVQDNTGYTTEGGRVTFYKLTVEHSVK